MSNYPDMCYVFVEVGAEIGIVKWGEKGYYRTEYASGKLENEELVNQLNSKLGVEENQAKAMKILSMNDSIDGNEIEWKAKFDDIIKRINNKNK